MPDYETPMIVKSHPKCNDAEEAGALEVDLAGIAHIKCASREEVSA